MVGKQPGAGMDVVACGCSVCGWNQRSSSRLGLRHRVLAASNSGAVFLENALARAAHEGDCCLQAPTELHGAQNS